MQTIQQFLYKNCWLLMVMTGLSACTLAGLDVQEDWDFTPHVADPHTNKTVWAFMQDRNQPGQDSVFNLMLQGIAYAGLDSTMYTQTGKTFILLHRDAILRLDNRNRVTTDCYFGRYVVPDRDSSGNPIPGKTRAAQSWTEYPKEQVKNFLLYLVVEGERSFGSIGVENDTVKTLLPPGTDTLNPQGIMTLKVTNDRDSKLKINDFLNTVRSTTVRTAGLLNTNGPAHVVDRVVEFGVKP
ncbi:fasciclin domain-containing protein [Chitinophaga japonensis]|uniref:Fasciclin domain-containing protein n=1 Tax=Chitinophaga japonensis TaxID=104662 RepID=A0A562T4Q8_CHIJA|nr:hypothetical protein [Chitinophaga japonensis]TWI87990.1 hypothetical protein LX66_2064 [Chitinophaga japonensis]